MFASAKGSSSELRRFAIAVAVAVAVAVGASGRRRWRWKLRQWRGLRRRLEEGYLNGDWSWYRGVEEFASAKLWKSCELKRLAVAVAVSVAVAAGE